MTLCVHEGCFAPLEPIRLALGKTTCCHCSTRARRNRDARGKIQRKIQDCLYCGLHGHAWYQCHNIDSVKRAIRLAFDVKTMGWIHIRNNRMHFRVHYIGDVWCASDVIELSWVGAKRVNVLGKAKRR